MIKLKNITTAYGKQIVIDDLSYTFNKGKVYGLIGKNGAGKTTLLKTMSRLISSNDGSIYIENDCIDEKDYFSVPISYVADTPSYFRDLTVKEHMLMICNSQKMSKSLAIENIKEVIKRLRLEQYEHCFPQTLSKGTLQKLNLALGLLRAEDIYLLDEPFSALDPVQVKAVEQMIISLKEKGKTQIVSSHDLDSLQSICDTYLILRNGKVLEYEPDKVNKEKIAEIIEESYGD